MKEYIMYSGGKVHGVCLKTQMRIEIDLDNYKNQIVKIEKQYDRVLGDRKIISIVNLDDNKVFYYMGDILKDTNFVFRDLNYKP